MSRRTNRLALLAKIETTYGTDPTPSGSADAIQASNVEFTPMAGDDVTRDLLLAYYGHQGVLLTNDHVRMAFDVEIAGAGTAGDVPAWGVLMRACAMVEAITANTSVAYTPRSAGEEAATLYYNLDGVNHVLAGARGNVQLNFNAKQIPRFRFTMTGLKGSIADTALPTVDLSDFVTPVPVSAAQTTARLHGHDLIAESFSVDVGNVVTPEDLIGLNEVEFNDRMTTGTATVRARALSDINWFTIAQNRTRAALDFAHGRTAGNIVEMDAPAVEIGRPTQGNTNNRATYQLPMMMIPNTGNDELVITVK
ncbi:MAG: phage tail tube protein [Pseudomonadota bacterium]